MNPSSSAGRPAALRAFVTPEPTSAPSRKESILILGASGAVFAWAFAYKMICYRDLTYTSDMFDHAQLATTWLKGRFLEDNCFGNHLSIHTYLLNPILAIFVLPFGPAGLLLALSLAMAAGFAAFAKILRLFGVPLFLSCLGAAVATAMPFSVQTYQDVIYGFNVELLMPAIGLWLAYFLLRRHWSGAIACSLALLSVKEEAPLLVAAIASSVLLEDGLRTAFDRNVRWRQWCRQANRPAIAVLATAIVALPVLMSLVQSQPVTGYSPGSFQRIHFRGDYTIDNAPALFAYVGLMLNDWLQSSQGMQWVGAGLAITCGTLILRPQFLVLGFVTSLVSWLMQDDLMWAPRFASSLTFLQVAAAIGFASAYHLAAGRRSHWSLPRLFLAGGAAAALVTAAFVWQSGRVTRTGEFYLLQSRSKIPTEDRRRADALYRRYEEARQPGEPAIASPYLFRYVAYPDLYWADRLNGRPEPVWALLDQGEGHTAVARYGDYELYAQDGRFALFRKRRSGG